MTRTHTPRRRRKADPVAALQRLIEAQELTEDELGRMLGQPSLGGGILRRECPLQFAHLERLGRCLHVAPELVLSLAD